jgi:hypothetical protein
MGGKSETPCAAFVFAPFEYGILVFLNDSNKKAVQVRNQFCVIAVCISFGP